MCDKIDILASQNGFRNSVEFPGTLPNTSSARHPGDNHLGTKLCQGVLDTAPVVYLQRRESFRAPLVETIQPMAENDGGTWRSVLWGDGHVQSRNVDIFPLGGGCRGYIGSSSGGSVSVRNGGWRRRKVLGDGHCIEKRVIVTVSSLQRSWV